MLKKTPQEQAKEQADKLKKLRAFVQQNKDLQSLTPLSNPEAIEKALKKAKLSGK